MTTPLITNPANAFGQENTFVGSSFAYVKNNGSSTISRFRTCMWTEIGAANQPALGSVPVVALYDTSAVTSAMFAGVAQEDIAPGETGLIVTSGYTLVWCDNNDPVYGSYAIPDAVVDGALDTATTPLSINTGYIGTFLGVEGTWQGYADVAPVNIAPFRTGP